MSLLAIRTAQTVKVCIMVNLFDLSLVYNAGIVPTFKNRNLLKSLRILFYPHNPLDENVEAFHGELGKAQ
jgi:hypothetical protein